MALRGLIVALYQWLKILAVKPSSIRDFNKKMTLYKSEITPITARDSEVFEFLSDFQNLKGLMPPQVANWQATKDTCSFTIQGLASLEMKMDANTPFSNVHVVSHGSNPIDYTLDYNIAGISEVTCKVTVVFAANLNPFIKTLASKALQNLVNLMAKKLQEVFMKS